MIAWRSKSQRWVGERGWILQAVYKFGNGQDTPAYLRILSSKDKQVILSRFSVSKFRMAEGIICLRVSHPFSSQSSLVFSSWCVSWRPLSIVGPTRSHLLHVYVTISLVVEGESYKINALGRAELSLLNQQHLSCLKFRASSKRLPISSRGIK